MYDRKQLEGYKKTELETIASSYGLEVKGTGSGKAVLKKDLVDALLEVFQSSLPEPQYDTSPSQAPILDKDTFEVVCDEDWVHVKEGPYDREFSGRGPHMVTRVEWERLREVKTSKMEDGIFRSKNCFHLVK